MLMTVLLYIEISLIFLHSKSFLSSHFSFLLELSFHLQQFRSTHVHNTISFIDLISGSLTKYTVCNTFLKIFPVKKVLKQGTKNFNKRKKPTILQRMFIFGKMVNVFQKVLSEMLHTL